MIVFLILQWLCIAVQGYLLCIEEGELSYPWGVGGLCCGVLYLMLLHGVTAL